MKYKNWLLSVHTIYRERVGILSIEDFELIHSKQLPTCFSGLVDSWPAICSSTHKWENLKNLSERIGLGHIVPIELGGTYMDKTMEVRYLELQEYLLYLYSLQVYKISKTEKLIKSSLKCI